MSGIISQIFKRAVELGLPITPQVAENKLVIEITERELKEIVLKDLAPTLRDAIEIKIIEGRIIVSVKLI